MLYIISVVIAFYLGSLKMLEFISETEFSVLKHYMGSRQ